MGAEHEKAKAAERGQKLSRAEVALEAARDKMHADPSAANRKAYAKASTKVAKARQAQRLKEEAAGTRVPGKDRPGADASPTVDTVNVRTVTS